MAPGSEVVALAPTGEPSRWVVKNGTPTDVTNDRRPDNLNPWGINFSDCQQDMRLDFPLTITGFSTPAAHVEVWAGVADCSVDANRNPTSAGVSHPCWQVAAKTGTQVAGTSPLSLTASLYARDVLRYEQPPTEAAGGQPYDPTFHSGSDGVQACKVQTDDSQVTINLYFLAVNSVEQVVGTPACYALGTDLVGPPPPPQVSVQPGDTLLSVSWTSPGTDVDLVGYDVWSDPPAGGAQSSSSAPGCGCSIAPGSQASEDSQAADDVQGSDDSQGSDEVVRSPDIGDAAGLDDAESGVELDANADASDASDGAPERDGATEAAADGAPGEAGAGGDAAAGRDAGRSDAGPPATDAGVCKSENLTGFSSFAGNGGISQIDSTYLAHSLAGATPPSSSSPLTLTGMKNGRSYALVVTSTDAFGNDGPASDPSCGVPQPVSDFWSTYSGDSGSVATCAFEEAGGGNAGGALIPGLLLATAAALLRRRSSSKHQGKP